MAYRNTLQADALAAFGDDLMLALARKIVAGEEDADSVESVFAQAQQVAADAEALLVDADWAAPEPLFSWAEFMAEEPAEPKRRSRRPAPASSSLFEWALEREAEPAGAGR